MAPKRMLRHVLAEPNCADSVCMRLIEKPDEILVELLEAHLRRDSPIDIRGGHEGRDTRESEVSAGPCAEYSCQHLKGSVLPVTHTHIYSAYHFFGTMT